MCVNCRGANPKTKRGIYRKKYTHEDGALLCLSIYFDLTFFDRKHVKVEENSYTETIKTFLVIQKVLPC